jgi:hypothetical protein
MGVDGAFLIVGGQAPELLAAIDQPLNTVARAVHGTIKRAASAHGALTGEGDAHAPLAQIAADALGAVALVADHPPWATPRPSPSWPADRALLQQRLEHRRFMRLTGRKHNHHRLALALGAQVHLRGKATLAVVAKRLDRGPYLG